jgi:signal peptidase I
MDNVSQSSNKNTVIINVWSIFWAICWIVILVLLFLRIFIYQQVNVVGQSMEPNYKNNERLVVNRKNKKFFRGQVVAIYEDKILAKNANYFTPYDPQTRFYLKRIIGLPGEEVEKIGGDIIIYSADYPEGKILVENYIDESVKRREQVLKDYYPRTKIGEGEYFVLGDNRTNSKDSRKTGLYPNYSIFGQETFRYWPLSEFDWFELPSYAYRDITDEEKKIFEEFRASYNSRNPNNFENETEVIDN